MSITPIIKIKITLKHKGDGTALAGEKYTVLLFDKDVFEDDFLSQGSPDETGLVKLSFPLSAISSMDSINETLPDLYFVVKENDTTIYTSKVAQDVDTDNTGTFDAQKGREIDLGTFLIG